ncbi:MAG: SPOR domain-containing protein [Cyanobacteria bacterium P01_D01_bin.44]
MSFPYVKKTLQIRRPKLTGLFKTGLFKLVLSLGTVISSGTASLEAVAQPTCEFLLNPEQLNSQVQDGDGVIRIGNFSEQPYLVVLPGADETDLELIRPCITDAYLTRSRLGRYLQAGAFANRSDAEHLARTLRNSGFRGRVIHRHSLRR